MKDITYIIIQIIHFKIVIIVYSNSHIPMRIRVYILC